MDTCTMNKNHTVTTILRIAEISTETCDDLQMERLIDLTPLDNEGCKDKKGFSEVNKKVSKSGNIWEEKGLDCPVKKPHLGYSRQCK
ncbi:hypothetical protein PspLS_04860 [Pyricularia sp. CBS 133598]|nr:hypothetical protein PspLS_04860 [Pyricularia sp. CBS 133598]